MNNFDKWLTERIDYYVNKGKLETVNNIKYYGIGEGLYMARQYFREYYTGEDAKLAKQCNHYWIKLAPLNEENQTYMCLNCDLHKKG